MTDLVSILVPIYNHAAFIDATLASAVAQTHRNLEIIIVDDGSEDDSAARCEAWAARDRRIAVHRRPHRGLCATHNDAISLAQGDYVSFLNSDDRYYPYKTRLQVEYVQDHPDVGAVFAWTDFIDQNGAPLTVNNHYNAEYSRQALPAQMVLGNRLASHAGLIRGSLVRTLGPMVDDLPYAHDFDYWMRLLLLAPIDVIPQPLVTYRMHTSNHCHSNAQRVARETWKVIERYFDPLAERYPAVGINRVATFNWLGELAMQSLDFADAARFWTALDAHHTLAERNRGAFGAALHILSERSAARDNARDVSRQTAS